MAYRKKFKKAKRAFKKTWKKAYRKKKSYRKKDPVKNRRKFTVSKRSKRPSAPMKFTVYQRPAFQMFPGWNTIWSSYGTDATGARFVPMPFMVTDVQDVTLGTVAQAVNQIQNELDIHGVVGRQFCWKYIDLRFQIRPVNYGGAVGAQMYDDLRLLIVRERNANQTLADIQNNYGMGTPILSKDWTIIYDKTFSMTTGLLQTTGNNNFQCLQDKPRQYRYKIPFKFYVDSNTYLRGVLPVAWNPDLATYLLFWTRYGLIAIDYINAFCYFK